jgi:hypothetical protein
MSSYFMIVQIIILLETLLPTSLYQSSCDDWESPFIAQNLISYCPSRTALTGSHRSRKRNFETWENKRDIDIVKTINIAALVIH